MEVDMQSPPSTFRTAPFSIKRPRSPGSHTQERHTKRLSLAPVGSEGQFGRRAPTAPDGVADGRTTHKDDWVRQARELSIASPLTVTSGFHSSLNGVRVDEHMAVDDEEAPALRVHLHPGGSRSWTSKSHLPLIHISTTTPIHVGQLHAPSPTPFSVLTEPPSSSTDSLSSTTSSVATQANVGLPDIYFLPATPSDTSSNNPHFGNECGQEGREKMHAHEQTVVSRTSLERLDGSPRPSRTDVPTSSSRKHRVTMGPRADCVKCRTGVRGHWMHFD